MWVRIDRLSSWAARRLNSTSAVLRLSLAVLQIFGTRWRVDSSWKSVSWSRLAAEIEIVRAALSQSSSLNSSAGFVLADQLAQYASSPWSAPQR